jgi:hypothetical protein
MIVKRFMAVRRAGDGMRHIVRRVTRPRLCIIVFAVLVCASAHLVLLCVHKTLGGWHFGQRYTNDMLPSALFGVALIVGRLRPGVQQWLSTAALPVLLYGYAINLAGIVRLFSS